MRICLISLLLFVMTDSLLAQQPPLGDPVSVSSVTGDIVYGDADAPVTIIEYVSLTCSHCGDFVTDIMPLLEDTYIKAGKVKLIMRHYLLNQVDLAASIISRCDGMDRSRKLLKKFLSTQKDWMKSENLLTAIQKIGESEGLTKAQMDVCLQLPDLQKAIIEQTKVGREVYQVSATPTLFINGKKFDDPISFDALKKAIAAALKADEGNAEQDTKGSE